MNTETFGGMELYGSTFARNRYKKYCGFGFGTIIEWTNHSVYKTVTLQRAWTAGQPRALYRARIGNTVCCAESLDLIRKTVTAFMEESE